MQSPCFCCCCCVFSDISLPDFSIDLNTFERFCHNYQGEMSFSQACSVASSRNAARLVNFRKEKDFWCRHEIHCAGLESAGTVLTETHFCDTTLNARRAKPVADSGPNKRRKECDAGAAGGGGGPSDCHEPKACKRGELSPHQKTPAVADAISWTYSWEKIRPSREPDAANDRIWSICYLIVNSRAFNAEDRKHDRLWHDQVNDGQLSSFPRTAMPTEFPLLFTSASLECNEADSSWLAGDVGFLTLCGVMRRLQRCEARRRKTRCSVCWTKKSRTRTNSARSWRRGGRPGKGTVHALFHTPIR